MGRMILRRDLPVRRYGTKGYWAKLENVEVGRCFCLQGRWYLKCKDQLMDETGGSADLPGDTKVFITAPLKVVN